MNNVVISVRGARFRIAIISLFAFVLATQVSGGAPPAVKRNITEKDLFDFVWIGDPQISPDGARVAFVRVTVNEKKDGYDTSIWMVSDRGQRSAASTDERRTRRLARAGRPTESIWSLPARRRRTGKPEPPQLVHAPDGGRRRVCFHRSAERRGRSEMVARRQTDRLHQHANPDDLAKQEKKKRKEEELKKAARPQRSPATAAKRSGSPEASRRSRKTRTNTRATCTSSRARFIDRTTKAISIRNGRSHLWIDCRAADCADEKVEPRQLTSGRFDEGDAVWSQDGAQIYFTSLHVDEPYYDLPKTELYAIPAKGGEARN